MIKNDKKNENEGGVVVVGTIPTKIITRWHLGMPNRLRLWSFFFPYLERGLERYHTGVKVSNLHRVGVCKREVSRD